MAVRSWDSRDAGDEEDAQAADTPSPCRRAHDLSARATAGRMDKDTRRRGLNLELTCASSSGVASGVCGSLTPLAILHGRAYRTAGDSAAIVHCGLPGSVKSVRLS